MTLPTQEEIQAALPYLTPKERKEMDRLLYTKKRKPAAIYETDPVAFVHDMFSWRDGGGPAFYQDEILCELPLHKRICVRAPHGVGKTALVSWGIIWAALTYDAIEADWKIPTTASVWRQLSKFLWPEIHKWVRKLRWDKLGRAPFNERLELLIQSLKLETGEAFALASDNPAQIEGAHADKLLYVFDEAKTIPVATWDAAEGAFSTGEALWLAVSTPGDPEGRFYDIQTRKPGTLDWWTRHITLDEAIRAGRILPEWAEGRRLLWGEKSAVYQNRVEGNFATESDTGVIPLTWVEKANERWYEWQELLTAGGDKGKMTCLGVDVAWMGEDKTTLAPRYGKAIDKLIQYTKSDIMETAGHVAALLNARGGYAIVDVVGVGAGVYGRLKELKLRVTPFSSADATDDTDKSGEVQFENVRAAAWWALREKLDPVLGEMLALPPDDLLTGDLTAVHWKHTSRGRVLMESKDDIRARIGRSTDSGDAVVMAYYRPVQTADSWLEALKKDKERREAELRGGL